MRAKDLKTDGTEYYYTTTDTWLKWTHQADRAVVLDATPGRWSYDRREEKWTRRPGGQDVLIEIKPSTAGNAARRLAVRTASLRGEWEACVRQREELKRQEQAHRQDRRAQLRKIADPCLEAAAALARLGIRAGADEDERSMFAQVTVNYRSAARLLAAVEHLESIGWKPPAD